MKKFRFICSVLVSLIISSCASTMSSTPVNNNSVTSLKENYERCLTQNGNASFLCAKEKRQLFRKQQDEAWDNLRLYGS